MPEEFRNALVSIGFTPESVFSNASIKPWRSLPDRENCIWDLSINAQPTRWHVKRFPATRSKRTSAELEANGYALLREHQIPTVTLVAWGNLDDGRSFIITEDLAGYRAGDKLLESGFPFAKILSRTAEIAAKLHNAGLHHRDLYLCHFLIRENESTLDIRLIDAARVANLPSLFFRRRWIVKDLAQFWYSTLAQPITDAQRQTWLNEYARHRDISDLAPLQKSILRKSNLIAVHDVRLHRSQPHRNISIPTD
jgi:hypothetical protein